jgi:vacuolar-type H+-ATPase subunit F/Vma7
MDIIAIGTTEFLPGFALAGVRTTLLADEKNVRDILTRHGDAGVIIIDETLLRDFTSAEREEVETSTKPVIISLGKDNEYYNKRLRQSIMETIGVDLPKERLR